MARAITETAKAAKANHILEKAYELYEKGTFKSIKMIDIANASGVSKGTMFNYYSTKEKLFLEMFKREFEKRVDFFSNELKKYDTLDHFQFKKFVLDEMENILIEDSVLIRLTIIIHITLEENIDYDSALTFKQETYDLFIYLGKLIAERVDYLTEHEAMEIFMAQHAIIVGYRNIANVPDVIKQVINEQELKGFKIDFKGDALKAMTYYLDGLYEKKKNQI